MKLPRYPLPWRQIFIVGLVYLTFKLTFTDFWAVYTIAKNPSGETVVSLGSGFEALGLLLLNERDRAELKHPISTVAIRNASGWPIAKYSPRSVPLDYAHAVWTDKFVLISSKDNGECPDFRVFDRRSGEAIDAQGDEVRALPLPLLERFDPCILGSKEIGVSAGKATKVEKTKPIH